MAPEYLTLLNEAQEQAAEDSIDFTPEIMAKLGTDVPEPSYTVPAEQFVGWGGNGQHTISLAWNAVIDGKTALSNGRTVESALETISRSLARITGTIIADTSRSSSYTAALGRIHTAHYVRALTPPSCGRCVILAGTDSASEAFERHPHCDCTAVWSDDVDALKEHTAYPEDYLDSLDDNELTRVLGSKANAEAYKDGADLNQLVNAYRRKGSVRPAQIYGRNIKYTTEGTTKRGAAYWNMKQAGYIRKMHRNDGERYFRTDRPRLMPETIYQIAGDDADKARQLLRNYGWILH